jgi:hypothetical protein
VWIARGSRSPLLFLSQKVARPATRDQFRPGPPVPSHTRPARPRGCQLYPGRPHASHAPQIDHKTAGLLLYALQTASFNLRRTDFEPVVKTKVVIDPTRVDETALGQSQWQNEDFENPEEPDEEDAEEAANGHLEIQAMADHNPRSDRRLACPARQRRSRRSPRLHSCLEFGSPLKRHNFIGSALKGQVPHFSRFSRSGSFPVHANRDRATVPEGHSSGRARLSVVPHKAGEVRLQPLGVCSVESAMPDII